VSSVKAGLFREDAQIWPYVSAGLGATNVGLKSGGVKDTKWGFSYDVGAGIEGPVGTSGAAVGIRYRFRGTELDVPVQTRAFVHAITVELLFVGLP
jgi:opacity protein-like surface antigen